MYEMWRIDMLTVNSVMEKCGYSLTDCSLFTSPFFTYRFILCKFAVETNNSTK